jgi:hypothetical protein
MCSTDELIKKNARLKLENQVLLKSLKQVSAERDKLRALQPFKSGLNGEKYIAEILQAKVTITNSRHDVETRSGLRLEVKLSHVNTPVQGKRTRRWAWSGILGNDGHKIYDRLILLGVIDDRHISDYESGSDKFIIFDIPYADVSRLLKKPSYLSITTRPHTIQSKVAKAIFQYQIGESELLKRYK